MTKHKMDDPIEPGSGWGIAQTEVDRLRAEIERLQALQEHDWQSDYNAGLEAERNALRAENERLRAEVERWRHAAESLVLRDDEA